MTKAFLALVSFVLATCSPCRSENVRIDGRDIPLEFAPGISASFDTNRVARELSNYFDVGIGVSRLFHLDEVDDADGAPLRPVCPMLPPESIAGDIVLSTNGHERITIGNTALNSILDAIDQSAILSNEWTQAETLLSSLSTGSITNDMTAARASFAINGTILSDPSRDEELLRGIARYWSRLRFFPPSLLDWMPGRFAENGPMIPAIRIKFVDLDMNPQEIDSVLLVFLDGLWRVALFE